MADEIRADLPSGGASAAALTAKVTVANQTARYALTTADVQNGDYVAQTDTGALYVVTDENNLGSSAGYQQLATNDAASITSGQLALARGGTGADLSAAGTGSYVRKSSGSALEARTTSQVLSDIGAAASSHTHAQSDVTSLVSDLAAKAPLASPTFTGTVTLSGSALTMSGSPASAGSTVRNIHGNGGTTDLVANVPTGGKFQATVNGASVLEAFAGALYPGPSSDFIVASGRGLRQNTSDGSDNGVIKTCGGGGFGDSRGALAELHGNEHSTAAGKLYLSAGNVTGAAIELYTAATKRLGINHDGSAYVDSTFAASLASALGVGAARVCMVYETASQSISTDTETVVTFSLEHLDAGARHSTSSNTGRITLDKVGKWLVMSLLTVRLATSCTSIKINFAVNGTKIAPYSGYEFSGNTSLNLPVQTAAVVDAAAITDYVDVRVTPRDAGCTVAGTTFGGPSMLLAIYLGT